MGNVAQVGLPGLLGLLVACATSAPPNTAGGGASHVPPPGQADGAPAEPPLSNDVRGVATLTIQTHCGGAMPAPGEVMSREQPAASRRLYVRAAGDGTQVAVVTTDAQGAFAMTLPPGEYCLVDSARADDKTQPSQWIDPECLASYRKSCDASFRVPRREPLAVALAQGCFEPCYRGPMPP
jgi:hypothetical protein